MKELTIGPDTVHVTPEAVWILAVREMPGWTVREFCRKPIYFQQRKYFLLKKEKGPPPYAMTYVLAPWSENEAEQSQDFIVYDEDYVAHREGGSRSHRRNDRLYHALIWFYPFIGFFWSSTKERFFMPVGFEAKEATGVSIMLEFCLAMVQAILIFFLGSGIFNLCFGREIWGLKVFWLDFAVFLILPVDCLVRYGRLLKGDEVQIGFLEWVFRR
ncbi:hypothetical protein [Pedosphaera parvula]|uniref:Uncharacterized protein n=1 Tax=Pedosphaera parvula (strain Ellin514) TaxID=320771 RepID=B9XP48_PEDPL|nr:hypothetical protein [Pedosphaera parvula]EEF58404.1 hypothetical protein Cflav_PD6147 [Pedosphaera parvula Ellin514]